MTKPGVSAARFLHLDGYNGWGFANRKDEVEPDHVPGVVVTPDGLTLPRGALPGGQASGQVIGSARARGFAFDRLGRPYAVAEGRRAFCLVAGRDEPPTPCWQLAPGPHRRFGGIAIDGRDRLYVALPKEGDVRVLRISPAGESARVPMMHPVAVAIDRQERLVVLDTGAGTPVPSSVTVVRIARQGDAIAASPSGALAIATRNASTIDVAPAEGGDFRSIDLGRPVMPVIAFARKPDAAGGEIVFVGDRMTGRIVMWRIENNHATPLRWGASAGPWAALAWRGDALYALGANCQVVPIALEEEGFWERSRTVVLGPFDSGIRGTLWHRVTADLVTPPTATVGVSVEILADDDCDAYDPALVGNDARWEPPRELVAPRDRRPAELAFLSARGRYAFLRLTLQGDGRHSPVIRWLRVEFPRNSYLRYLPAVYSEDPSSRSLTARFLSLFEAANVELSSEITELRRLFEPYTSDPEFFRWLAERLDVLLEPDWSEERTRRALADAFWVFRRRGTRQAMQRLLLDHGGPGIAIVEGHHQRTSFFLGSASLGCGSILPGGCSPARVQLDRGVRLGAARLDSKPFVEADPIIEQRGELTIFVPPSIAAQPELLDRVTRIANLEAPAGAGVKVVSVTPNLALGYTGRLGIDAALGARSAWRLPTDSAAALPDRTWTSGMLLARDPGIGGDLALGRGPRLGQDSRL